MFNVVQCCLRLTKILYDFFDICVSDDDKARYRLEIKTASGTKDSVSARVHGKKGRTDWHKCEYPGETTARA